MRLPEHVAIIMDGNGRWAERRGLPRMLGHQAGFIRMRSIVKTALLHKIKYLTVYSFSTENWNRPEEEVRGIFNILLDNIDSESVKLHAQGVKIRHIGRLFDLPEDVQECIRRACDLTRDNTRLTFSFAFNYGGRIEILDAARRLVEEKITSSEIDEKAFENRLYTAGLPEVDLVIRTGGELRISNFLLWEAAYAEYYFTRILWPDFTPRKFEKALEAFGCRKRRFGGL
jgi:undecaprenyl diphosphate synthase